MRDFIFLGSKITADGDCSHEIKRCLLLRRKAVIDLELILKSRDITLLTKVRRLKAMVFSVVKYGCDNCMIKKAVCVCCAQLSLTVCDPMWAHQAPQSRKNTGVGCRFLLQRLFPSDGRSIGASASASALPMTIQGSSPLGLTDFISLLSKGLARILQCSAFFILTSVHDYWKNHSFD